MCKRKSSLISKSKFNKGSRKIPFFYISGYIMTHKEKMNCYLALTVLAIAIGTLIRFIGGAF